HVEGRNFYPPMLVDLAAAASSIHINQFGFRPGKVGDLFASALREEVAQGVAGRLVVDRQGSHPDEASREFYEQLVAGGVEVCVVRATKARVRCGPRAAGGWTRWNRGALVHIAHRKFVIVDVRVGWIGGAGVEDHFED